MHSFYRSRPICLIVVFLLLPLPWRYATDSGLNCFVLKMRRHLYNCLEDGLMRHFPAYHRQRRHETSRTEMIKVFCKCRLQEEGKMICCDRCQEWYHSTCEVNVPASAWRGDTTWTCLRAAVTQCNCTSLMITVTTSFSVIIIKIITDSDYMLQQPSETASSVVINNFRA